VLQCENCIEYLLEDTVMSSVDAILEKLDMTTELQIIRYVAA